jgi:AcrR family transcriptional regulator
MNSASNPSSRRTGRRPGDSTETRDAILEAAREAFAADGYERTSLRGVARAAGVDPALVVHYFGSKPGLFEAAMRPPFDPAEALPRLLAGDPETAGLRLATFAVGIWDAPASRRILLGIVRAATSDERAAEMLRAMLVDALTAGIRAALGAPDAALRANLVGAQIVGMGMARHVLRIEPLASADGATVAAWIAPALQRYLTGAPPGAAPTGGD